MPPPPAPLSREDWIKSREKLARALKGEAVLPEEIPDGKPEYRCPPCMDTAFVVQEDLDGVKTSRRCPHCRARVDGEIRSRNPVRNVEIEDDPAPAPRDFRKLAGDDED